jgi:hypothetical protein
VSIADFDVEPVVGPRFWAVVLGIVSVVSGVLAVIGWPLPVIAGRGDPDRHAWAQTVRGVRDWIAHDGWRMSGTSWIYGALAVAALAGIVVVLHPGWTGARSWLVVVGPAGALLVLGPVAQWALGLPWSNYGGRATGPTGATGSTGGIALGTVATVLGGAVVFWLRRAVRRSVRPEDDVNPQPRGVQ